MALDNGADMNPQNWDAVWTGSLPLIGTPRPDARVPRAKPTRITWLSELNALRATGIPEVLPPRAAPILE